ncbi:hypothetical protein GCM10025781_06590 [Kocuria gwangalliensis]|uniref:Uncharacterized protein n=1 Tax=Kocuria gwangalliensis TaxID=501592 RepID=A0ABP8WNW8_9MICC
MKARALQLIEVRIHAEQCSCTADCGALGGFSPHTLRNKLQHNRIDHGAPRPITGEAVEILKPRRVRFESRCADEILRRPSVCFAFVVAYPPYPSLRRVTTRIRSRGRLLSVTLRASGCRPY